MYAILTTNDVQDVIKDIQEYLDKGGIIKSVKVVDQTDNQVVVILDDTPITQEKADIWWSGYRSGLEQALD